MVKTPIIKVIIIHNVVKIKEVDAKDVWMKFAGKWTKLLENS